MKKWRKFTQGVKAKRCKTMFTCTFPPIVAAVLLWN